MSILGSLLSSLNPIESITNSITKVMIAKENAKNKEERIRADVEIETLRAKRDAFIAASGHRITTLIQALFALIAIIYLTKVVVFDKVFGAWLGWSTDPLSPWLTVIMGEIIAFYFVSTVLNKMFGR